MTELTALRHPVGHFDTNTLEVTNASVSVSEDGLKILVSTHDGWQHVKTPVSAQPQQGVHINDAQTAEVNVVIVQQATDGHLVIATSEDAVVEFAGFPEKDLEVGQLTQNGVFIGASTDTDGAKRAWFADINDVQDSEGKRLKATFKEAAAIAKERNAQNYLNHDDWIVAPTANHQPGAIDVLKTLFNNRAAVGGFEAGAQYWSSTPVFALNSNYKHTVDFKTGVRGAVDENTPLSFRLVRSVKL